MDTKTQKIIPLECPCGRKWNYKGSKTKNKKNFYTSCPDCHMSILVEVEG